MISKNLKFTLGLQPDQIKGRVDAAAAWGGEDKN